MEKVTIKNTTVGSVGLLVPEIRLNRLIKQNGTITIDKDLLEEALTYPGVSELFEDGDLALIGEEVRLEFGLQNEGEEVFEESQADFDEIKKILASGTPLQLKNLLADASESRKSVIAQACYECDNISMAKIETVTKATGIDILSGIKSRQLMKD